MFDKILILGGAGFIGSNLASYYSNEGAEVTVIDGMLAQTGASFDNIKNIINNIRFIPKKIEDVSNLYEYLIDSNLIIDAMAWTSHNLAFDNPFYDMELNQLSHLFLINKLMEFEIFDKTIIYLGSIGQYGKVKNNVIHEYDNDCPQDIQGIHKSAAESYFRVYSRNFRSIICLRLPNVFGQYQKYSGGDIGLIGSIISDLLNGNEIELFGKARMRNILFAGDIPRILGAIANNNLSGFDVINIPGNYILIEELIQNLITIHGSGSYKIKELPEKIKIFDSSSAELSGEKLNNLIGNTVYTDLNNSLKITYDYFREKIK